MTLLVGSSGFCSKKRNAYKYISLLKKGAIFDRDYRIIAAGMQIGAGNLEMISNNCK